MSEGDDELLRAVGQMVARERLALDDTSAERTCFLSHVGAQERLAPGAWIAHRDLLYAMALANLSPPQRTSLAQALMIEYGREFGVGRLRLEASASGLPLGGSHLRLEHRQGGPVCLYTWALGLAPSPVPCDAMLVRAQPEWALDHPPRPLQGSGLRTLVELGGEVLVMVTGAAGAVQIARTCAPHVPLAAHPRFAPYIEGLSPEAPVLLWPHDALEGAGLRRHKIMAIVLVGAPEEVRTRVHAWWAARRDTLPGLEIVEATCPGRMDRAAFETWWTACGRPRVLLRGDPLWAASGAGWLRELGVRADVQGRATQLSMF